MKAKAFRVKAQRWMTPPVELVESVVVVRVEGERITGLGCGETVLEASRGAVTGRMVEA